MKIEKCPVRKYEYRVNDVILTAPEFELYWYIAHYSPKTTYADLFKILGNNPGRKAFLVSTVEKLLNEKLITEHDSTRNWFFEPVPFIPNKSEVIEWPKDEFVEKWLRDSTQELAVKTRREEALTKGLTDIAQKVLKALEKSGRLSKEQLKADTGYSGSSMQYTIETLKSRGLIQSVDDLDNNITKPRKLYFLSRSN